MSVIAGRAGSRRSRSVAALQRRLRADDGTSLIEITVGLTLMAVFMAMFTGAIVMMNRSMNLTQAVNTTASQLNTAFTNLDNTIRYANYVTTPGVSVGSGNWYVELRSSRSGQEVCTQLRVDKASQQLQSRTWNVTDAVATTPSTWQPIASGISNGNAAAGATTQPFYIVPAAANAASQQLAVNLTAPAGSGSAQVTSQLALTFTAMNSTASAPVARICLQPGRP